MRSCHLRPSGPGASLTPMSRDWTAARAKVDAEGVCRVGRISNAARLLCDGPIDAAHVIDNDWNG